MPACEGLPPQTGEGDAQQCFPVTPPEADPTDETAAWWYSEGLARKKEKKWPEAIAAFRRCVALDPKHADAHIDLGNVLNDVRKDYDGAERHYRKAFELNSMRACWQLSFLLENRKNDIPGAIEAMEKYIQAGNNGGEQRLARLRAKATRRTPGQLRGHLARPVERAARARSPARRAARAGLEHQQHNSLETQRLLDAKIRPYGTALAEEIDAEKDKQEQSIRELRKLHSKIQSKSAKILSAQQQIAREQDVIQEESNSLKRLLQKNVEEGRLCGEHAQKRARLQERKVPAPGVYSELISVEDDRGLGFALVEKIDDVAKNRAAGGGFYLGIVNSARRLWKRLKEETGKRTNGGHPTMLVIHCMKTVDDTKFVEKRVVEYGKNSYPRRFTWEGGCTNNNAGGGGVKDPGDEDPMFWLYIVFEDKAR